jgi:hypothetical protein
MRLRQWSNLRPIGNRSPEARRIGREIEKLGGE